MNQPKSGPSLIIWGTPTPDVPQNGGQAAAARDDDIEEFIHLFFLNRGILLSPFHNMALVSPYSTQADVQTYLGVFGEVTSLLASRD